MLSQFISEKDGALLGDLSFDFPPGTHAIGRLDKHSEGLLLLTTNKKVTRLLFQGDILHKRTYLVQVKKMVNEETLQRLRNGVSIRVMGGGNISPQPAEQRWLKNLGACLKAETAILFTRHLPGC